MPRGVISKRKSYPNKKRIRNKAVRGNHDVADPDLLPEAVKRVLEVLHPELYNKEHLH